MRSRLIGLVVVVVAATACTDIAGNTETSDPEPVVQPGVADDTDESNTNSSTPIDAPTTSAEPSVMVPDGPAIIDGVADSLILVHDIDGGERALVSYRADGTEVTNYSGGPDELIIQPIWSPDGRRIAWARAADGEGWELVTAAVDGTDLTVHELPGRPDYITYDPTASRMLALTPSPSGFGLVIIELDGEATADPGADRFQIVDLGAPYFSDFAPDGNRLIAHVGTDLRVVDLSGEVTSLELTSGSHQTPAWHPQDDTVFFTTDTGDGERLVSYELGADVRTELGVIVGVTLFDLDPTGTRLAVMAYATARAPGGLEAIRQPGARQTSTTPDTVLETGLWVIDVADGRARLLDDRPETAPLWDPTGSRVLVRDALDGVGRWNVFELDGTSTGTDEYDIDQSQVPAYLPFWDQYARSQTVWSPDGGHFVHVGRAISGESGVWIHDASTSGKSILLAGGDIAFWSPT